MYRWPIEYRWKKFWNYWF